MAQKSDKKKPAKKEAKKDKKKEESESESESSEEETENDKDAEDVGQKSEVNIGKVQPIKVLTQDELKKKPEV